MNKSTLFKPIMCAASLLFSLQAKLQIITTVAGNGSYSYSGDGELAINASLGVVSDVDFDAGGNMYITADGNSVIRKVNMTTGIITTVAGNSTAGYSGDGGLAVNAQLNHPTACAIDSLGNIYITDTRNYRVRKVDAITGVITTIAGTGVWGGSGDGGLAVNALLGEPEGIALNRAGTILYVADAVNSRIRQINLVTGIISSVAGTGVRGYNGDGILAINAYLNSPAALTVSDSGDIYFSDNNNYRIRKISASTGIITTIAGNGTQGYSGDWGLATNAVIGYSNGISLDKNGHIFFSQLTNHIIRAINSGDKIISTVAGSGFGGDYGDGDYATNASLKYPYGVTTDSKGNFYVADHDNCRVRKVTVDSLLLNEIFGYTYYDLNSNNAKDNNEQLFGQAEIIVKKNSDSIITFTPQGDFRIGVDTGAYLSSAVPYKNYYIAVPQSHTSNFSTYNNIDTVYFAMQPVSGKRDLRISAFALRPSRPGFGATYKILYQNVGTDTVLSGEIQFIKDSKYNYVSSIPNYSSIHGDTLKWNYTNVKPLDTASISVTLTLASSVIIGDTLHSYAIIAPIAGDLSPNDDTATVSQITIGSYDPNNKSENHGGSVLKAEVAKGDYLSYIIRFQNTGTYSTYNIAVRDTLSDKLDWNTFQMVDASHDYQLKITDGNKCTWTFNRISLPDSNTNEPASHGYIVYRIKAKSTLHEGDIINNAAGIYFDYNLPVRTNIESTIVENIVLPLDLLSFTAEHGDKSNLLKWSTSNEINTDHFEIERSNDGRNYLKLGTVRPISNGKSKNDYVFTDAEPLKTVNYYRLKMIDKDGKYSYSVVRMVNNAKPFDVTSYPNPVKNLLTLNFSSENTMDIQIQVVNTEGKIIVSKKLHLNEGVSKQVINVASLSAGSYFVKCISEDGEIGLRFIKQ